jgi:hypothetical protein
MSKDPLKSFIINKVNKVGTFRGIKRSTQRPSATDLKSTGENDENAFKSPPGSIDDSTSQFGNDHCSDLDTTTKSIGSTSHLFR